MVGVTLPSLMCRESADEDFTATAIIDVPPPHLTTPTACVCLAVCFDFGLSVALSSEGITFLDLHDVQQNQKEMPPIPILDFYEGHALFEYF